MKIFQACSIVTSALLLCAQASAALFEVNVTGGPTVSGSSLLDLTENLVKAQGDFLTLQNQAFTASLTYGGVQNALNFSVNNTGTSARLFSGISGLDRTFTGANRSDVEDQIQNFLKKEGSDQYAELMKALSQKSTVSVSDGNPIAMTARIAAQSFFDNASAIGETREEKENPKELSGAVGFGFVADAGRFSSQGLEGNTYSLPLYARFKLSSRVGLLVNLPLNYTEVESAKVFSAGLGFGVPVKIILPTADQPWGWQLTPAANASAFGSLDMVAGGLIANGGISSLLSYNFKYLTLSMGNQFTHFEGVPIDFADVNIDPGVKQDILKNGLKVSVPIGRRWIFEAYGIRTDFLKTAAIEEYYTVGAEIGYRFLGKADAAKHKRGYVKLGVYSDLADDYTAAHVQFGTGWKF